MVLGKNVTKNKKGNIMKFIDKLIEETKQGLLDYVWEFYGNSRFKYNEEKHPLKDLNFSLGDIVTKEKIKDSGKPRLFPMRLKPKLFFQMAQG